MKLCSRHVLVMEYLDGVKLVDGIKEKYGQLAAMQGKSFDDIMEDNAAKMKAGTFKYKTLAESRREQERIKFYLACRDWLFTMNIPRLLYNVSPVRLLTGPLRYSLTDEPLNLGKILELLCAVEGTESTLFYVYAVSTYTTINTTA